MGEEIKRYMLDTNIASYIIKGTHDAIKAHLGNVPMASICVSSMTQAELLRSVAKKSDAKHLPVITSRKSYCNACAGTWLIH